VDAELHDRASVDANDPPVPDETKQRIANDPAVRDIMNVLQRGYEKVKAVLEDRYPAHRSGLDGRRSMV